MGNVVKLVGRIGPAFNGGDDDSRPVSEIEAHQILKGLGTKSNLVMRLARTCLGLYRELDLVNSANATRNRFSVSGPRGESEL